MTLQFEHKCVTNYTFTGQFCSTDTVNSVTHELFVKVLLLMLVTYNNLYSLKETKSVAKIIFLLMDFKY